jgi:hypothetical protein
MRRSEARVVRSTATSARNDGPAVYLTSLCASVPTTTGMGGFATVRSVLRRRKTRKFIWWLDLAGSGRSASRLANGRSGRSLRSGCPAGTDPCRSYERGTEYLESGRSRGHTGQCNRRVDQGRDVILLPAVGPYVPAPLALSQPSTIVAIAPAIKAWIAGGSGIAAVSRLPPNRPAR